MHIHEKVYSTLGRTNGKLTGYWRYLCCKSYLMQTSIVYSVRLKLCNFDDVAKKTKQSKNNKLQTVEWIGRNTSRETHLQESVDGIVFLTRIIIL